MLFHKAKAGGFDRKTQKPMIRASICTGERVIGFCDIQTGKFTEYQCIHNDKELQNFLKQYGIEPGEVTTQW